MKLNTDNITKEENESATKIYSALKSGSRCFGSPAEGLRKTLDNLETKHLSVNFTKTQWVLTDLEYEEQVAKLKAGIDGEEQLAEYLSTLLKYKDDLDGVLAFASMSFEQDNTSLGYIPDSDFLLVHGSNFMILDAKNVNTNPGKPLYVEKTSANTEQLVTANGKVILDDIHDGCHIWKAQFEKAGITYDTFRSFVCIVNKKGADIIHNDYWQASTNKVIHISELENLLMDWVTENRGNATDVCSLKTLVAISKAQIKRKQTDLDLTQMKKEFKI